MTRTRLIIVSLLTLAGAAVAVPAIEAAPTCTIGWTGAGGTDAWGNAANWNENRVPNSDDHVCVDQPGGGTVVITSGASVQTIQGAQTVRLQSGTLSVWNTGGEAILAGFEQTGGTLSGTGTLRVGSTFDWTGGEHSDTGLLKVDGTTHIHTASSVVLGVARRLETKDGSWTSGRIEVRNQLVWTVTGTFDMRAEDGWIDFSNHNNSTPAVLTVNSGATVVKTAVSPTSEQDTSFDTDVEMAIDNDGTVRAEAGRLRFGNGSYGATGLFESTTGELVFMDRAGYGQTFQMEGSTFDGLELEAGRLDVAAGKLFSGTDFKQSGGTIRGAGTLQTTNLEWTGGLMEGEGLTQDLGTANIHSDGSATLGILRRLEVHDGAWTSGRVEGRNRAVWTVTGTFDMRPESGGGMDADFSNHDNTARSKFYVASGGKLVKTASDPAQAEEVTRTDFAIENDGLVETSVGRLEFHGGGGDSNGSFASTGAGRTALSGGHFTMGDGGNYDGFEIAGSAWVEVVSGATYTGLDLWQTGGTIAGTGTLETTGTFVWSGGGMENAGLTRSTGTTHIQLGDVFLGILRQFETVNGSMTGNGRMEVRNRALWTNKGSFDLRAERGDSIPEVDYSNHDNTAWPVLKNDGTLVRTLGAGSTDLQIGIENDGTTDASAGRMTFTLGGGESNGSFGSSGDGRTVLAAETFTVGNGSFDGFEVSGGRVNVAAGSTYSGVDLWQSGGVIGGAGTLVSSGSFDWTGGGMDDSGLTRSTGTTHIHPPSDGVVHLGVNRDLETKDGSLTGAGRMEVRNRAQWTVTGAFEMLAERADGVPEVDYNNHDNTDWPVLHITTGAMKRTAGGGATDVEIQLDNDGSIETSSGRLRFIMGGGESTGSVASTGDGRTVFGGGTFTFGNGSFDGFEVDGGRVDVSAGNTYSGADVWLTGGAIGGAGTLESTGSFDWTGGGFEDAGLTRSTGTMTIHPPAAGVVHLGVQRKLETGDGEWTSGRLEVRNRVQWTNKGDFDLRSETGWIDYANHDNTDWPWLRNTGTILKTAGTGNTDVEMPFENDGTVDVQSGRLRFLLGGAESAGAFDGSGGGRAVLAGGTFSSGDSTFTALEVGGSARLNVNADRTLSGTDLFISGGGVIAGAGDVTSTGTVDATGGMVEDNGTLTAANLDVHPPADGVFTIGRGRRLETAGGAWRSGRFEFLNRAHWENTGTFDLRSEDSLVDQSNWDNTGPASMHNTGTLTRSDASPEAPPVNVAFEVPIDNDGAITSQSGEIHLNGGSFGTSTGSFQGVSLNGGEWTFGQGASFSTGGRIWNAKVTLVAGVTLTMAGGTLDETHVYGDGDLLVPSGELIWHGGSINGSGLFHIAEGATLSVEDMVGHYITGHRLLQNEGEIIWREGAIQVSDNATLVNEGTLELAQETPWYTLGTTGLTSAGQASLVNTGTIVKKTGTGTVHVHGLDNEGVLDIRSGTVYAMSLRQLAGGKVLATLGGTARGTQHGALDLSSSRGIAGRVAVRLADGYAPADGDKFEIVNGGTAEKGFFTAENLTLPGGGTLTGAIEPTTQMLTFTASMPAPERAEAEAVAASPAPAPALAVEAQDVVVADSVLRLTPGREASVALPEGATVELITRTKRATVRFDRKARKLRVKLRRDARGRRLKLRYRVIAADGTRSKITTLTVRISRVRR